MTTLTSQITLDMGNTVAGEPWNQVLWTMGLVLLLISFAFVALVRRAARRRSDDQHDDARCSPTAIATGRPVGRRDLRRRDPAARSSSTSCSRRSARCRSIPVRRPERHRASAASGRSSGTRSTSSVLTLLITVPLGTLGGIYMAEYAGDGPAHEPDPLLPGADQLGALDRRRPVRAGAVRQRHPLELHGARRARSP